MDGGGVPCLTEELSVVGVFWEREDCFSLGMLPLKGYLGSSRWSYTHAQTGYTKLSQWVLNQERVHEVGKKKWGDKEEIRGEGTG